MSDNQAWLRFYEELNDFLPSARRKTSFAIVFKGSPAIKNAIEEIGVPHVEIDLILVNGNPVNFSYRLKNDDHVSVYPVFEGMDISETQKLREKPLREPRFILDVHLGKLSKYIRLCGFDALFKMNLSDREIVRISVAEKRIILTRDRDLLKTKLVTHGYWIRSSKPDEQLKEVLRRFDLKNLLKPFSRCLECNGSLYYIPKDEIMDQLQPNTRDYYTEFSRCCGCKKIYWQGSHYEKMKDFIEELVI
jgi:uncharacterized protein